MGLGGELEHANAMLTTVFATPLREAVGGAEAWIPSFTKLTAPGALIDVPLAHKDALYVRSHYDGVSVTLPPDAPAADEVALIVCSPTEDASTPGSAAWPLMPSAARTACAKQSRRLPMRTAIVNLGTIVTGDLRAPFAAGSDILMEDGRISEIGTLSSKTVSTCDVVVDAAGTTAIPGLIDSHVHITFGDYTPRQRVVGYLESYLHGGTTTSITASEVHVPGRPKDPAGVKALALAARACFLDYRPGGMRVHAGSIILERA